jgi:hypothetical protein
MSYYVPVTVIYTVTIKGGQAPYQVTMDFGDGTTQTATVSTQATSTTPATVQFTKTYNTPATYVPKVTVRDNVGQTATAQASLNAISPTQIYQLSVSLGYTVQSQGQSYKIVPLTAGYYGEGYLTGRFW